MKFVKIGTIVKHLKELGIECKYMSGSFVNLYWRGEEVGIIYERYGSGNPKVVHIFADLKSVAGPDVDSLDIEISRDDWKETLGAAVYHLQGSEERFIDMTKAKRVLNIRSYFKKRKELFMMTMFGRLTDALNGVGTAFKELKCEQSRRG